MVKRKFAFNFEFLLYCFYTSLKGKFFYNRVIVSFPDDIEVFSDQLKRFNKSVIDPKCLLKIAATSFCFDNNLSFSSNIICILLFIFEKCGLRAFQNGWEFLKFLEFLSFL